MLSQWLWESLEEVSGHGNSKQTTQLLNYSFLRGSEEPKVEASAGSFSQALTSKGDHMA